MAQLFEIPIPGKSRVRQSMENLIHSHRLTLALNQARSITGIGNYWRWVQVPELQNGIEIAGLVSPLRYDVLVRREFYSFYENHRILYHSDWKTFMAMARRTSYYTWYIESEAVRTNPRAGSDLQSSFAQRVDRAIALYEDVKNNGFSPNFPIVLKTAKRILPPTTDRGGPPTSKRVGAKFFLADGCHRLALLMALGHTVLPAEYFRVKQYQAFSPFDSTSLLARRLVKDASEYFRYLSTFYTAPTMVTNRNELLKHIQAHRPELLGEVMSVIQADGFDE